MSQKDLRTEFRVGVVMAGGVSLAIWIGGVAAELLHLVEKPDDYGFGETDYRARIDIITGTSAGGLNGALMGAALAWGVPPEQFADDVRETWIRLADITHMLRPALEKDPPSLFRGEAVFEAELQTVLGRWRAWSGAVDSNKRAYRGHGAPSVALTTTLAEPHKEVYFDTSGQVLIEPRHTAKITFRPKDFDRRNAVQLLARAGRATAAFPVAFEPTFLPGEADKDLDMRDLVDNLPDGGMTALDGGLLVNRPLTFALDQIKKRDANQPFERAVAYVVPDPSPDPETLAGREKGGSVWRTADSTPSLPAVLGRVVGSVMTESLADDLDRWRERNLALKRHRDIRLSLGGLDDTQIDGLVNAFYHDFLQQSRHRSSTTRIQNLMDRGEHLDRIPWQWLEALMADLDEKNRLLPSEFPTDRPGPDDEWQWGFHPVRYAAETMRWMVRGVDEPDPTAKTLLDTIGTVLAALDSFFPISGAYWDRRLKGVEDLLSDRSGLTSEQRRAEVANVIGEAWNTWPQIDDGDLEYRQLMQTYLSAVRELERPEQGVATARAIAPKIVAKLDRPDSLTRHDHLKLLTYMTYRLGDDFLPWARRSLNGSDRSDSSDRTPDGLDEKSRLIRLAEACCREGGNAADAGIHPVWNLLRLWIIEVRTNQESMTGDPVDLFQISANHGPADVGLGLLPNRATKGTGKVTGIQLAHFGAFYKGSWRANDWMWGRLDGARHLAVLVKRKLDPSDDMDQKLIERHTRIGESELKVLAAQLRDEQVGGKPAPEENTFLVAADSLTNPGPGLDADAMDNSGFVAEALNACRVGEGLITNEVRSDRFAATSTHSVAVLSSALQGEKSGLGVLRPVFGQVRNLVILPIHAVMSTLGSAHGSTTSLVVALAALLMAILTVLVDFGLGIEVPGLVAGLALAILAGFVLASLPNLRRMIWSAGFSASMLFVAGTARFYRWWSGGEATPEGVTLTCDVEPQPMIDAEGRFVISQGCEVVAQSGDHLFNPRLLFPVALVLLAISVRGIWGPIGRAIRSYRDLRPRVSSEPLAGTIGAVRHFYLLMRGQHGLAAAVATSFVAAAVGLVLAISGLAGIRDPEADGWFASAAVPFITRWESWLFVTAILLPPVVGTIPRVRRPKSETTPDRLNLDDHIRQLRSQSPGVTVGWLTNAGTDTERRRARNAYLEAGDSLLINEHQGVAGNPGAVGDVGRIHEMITEVVAPEQSLDKLDDETQLLLGHAHMAICVVRADNSLHRLTPGPGRFKVSVIDETGTVRFTLVDAGGTELLRSYQDFQTKQDALVGINSVKANAANPDHYRLTDDSSPSFTLCAANGKEIGASPQLFSAVIRNMHIAWLQRHAHQSAVETLEPSS